MKDEGSAPQAARVLSLPPQVQALLEAIPGFALLLNKRHEILALNERAVRELDRPRSEILGKLSFVLTEGQCEPELFCPLRKCVENDPEDLSIVEVREQTVSGWKRVSISPLALRTSDGQRVFLQTVVDIDREVQAVVERDESRQLLVSHLESQRLVAAILMQATEGVELDVIFAKTLEMLSQSVWRSLITKAAIFTLDQEKKVLQMRVSIGLEAARQFGCEFIPLGHCLCGQVAESGELLSVPSVDELFDILPVSGQDLGYLGLPIVFEGRVFGLLSVYFGSGSISDSGVAFLKTVANTLVTVIMRDEALRRQRLLEAELRHSQKIEVVGRLAGGMAHDFNNLLAVIKGYGEMVLEELGDDHPASSDMREVLGATTSAMALTRQLLGLSHRMPAEPEIFCPDAFIQSMEQMLNRLLGDRIDLEIMSDAPGVYLNADRSEIEQIILNLIVNARDAMHAGGVVQVKTRQVLREDDEEVARRWWSLEVRDEGVGIPEELRGRIFEPFFTTKSEVMGTGLGLSMVRDIVRRYGGEIEVESTVGVGSVMRLRLPAERSKGPAADLS